MGGSAPGYIRPIKDNGGVLERAYEKATTAICGLVKGVSFKALEVPPITDPEMKQLRKHELHLEVRIPQKHTRELHVKVDEAAREIGAKTGTDILVTTKWS